MHRVAIFAEDQGHRQIIGPLVKKIAASQGMDAALDWRSMRHGYGKVAQEFERFLIDLRYQDELRPDMVVVATDANCKGLNARRREFNTPTLTSISAIPIVSAIPDPHVERWLLLDGAAFKAVFGKGCKAPDLKCERDRYKERLINEIRNAGGTSRFGGIEFAEEIVGHMDIDRAARADPSFKRFVEDLKAAIQELLQV